MASKLEKQLAKLLKKARTQVKKGNLQKAFSIYKEAGEIGRYDERLWSERAEIAEQLGDVQEAAESYFHLADMCARSGQLPKGGAYLHKTLSLVPRHGGARALSRVLGPHMPQSEPTPAPQP
ncbi:MAG: hypothetical protein KJO07_10420, partial [Deltaproteobacteria bacterium]|nr:hypothetical protein [Deltaproteobacteria bacterium]